MVLTRLPDSYAVCRAAPDAAVPAGVLDGPGFRSVSRTADELSVVAPEPAIEDMDQVERGWTAFKLEGPFAFDEIGVIATLSRPIADAKIGIFVISTFDTDYVLVKSADAEHAARTWRAAGHAVDEQA